LHSAVICCKRCCLVLLQLSTALLF
jgi:hypothetical protein